MTTIYAFLTLWIVSTFLHINFALLYGKYQLFNYSATNCSCYHVDALWISIYFIHQLLNRNEIFSKYDTISPHVLPVMQDWLNIMLTYRLIGRRRLGRHLRRLFVDVEQVYHGLRVMMMIMITNKGWIDNICSTFLITV